MSEPESVRIYARASEHILQSERVSVNKTLQIATFDFMDRFKRKLVYNSYRGCVHLGTKFGSRGFLRLLSPLEGLDSAPDYTLRG